MIVEVGSARSSGALCPVPPRAQSQLPRPRSQACDTALTRPYLPCWWLVAASPVSLLTTAFWARAAVGRLLRALTAPDRHGNRLEYAIQRQNRVVASRRARYDHGSGTAEHPGFRGTRALRANIACYGVRPHVVKQSLSIK